MPAEHRERCSTPSGKLRADRFRCPGASGSPDPVAKTANVELPDARRPPFRTAERSRMPETHRSRSKSSFWMPPINRIRWHAGSRKPRGPRRREGAAPYETGACAPAAGAVGSDGSGLGGAVLDVGPGRGEEGREGHDVVGRVEVALAGADGLHAALVYPIETHIAQKLHAYTMPSMRPNTRVKDLPDIALLGAIRPVDATRLRTASEQTFTFRKTHPLPEALPDPEAAWTAPCAAMARAAATSEGRPLSGARGGARSDLGAAPRPEPRSGEDAAGGGIPICARCRRDLPPAMRPGVECRSLCNARGARRTYRQVPPRAPGAVRRCSLCRPPSR